MWGSGPGSAKAQRLKPKSLEERSLPRPAALVADQPRLRLEPAAIAGKGAIRSDHAMTWHDDRDRVRAVCHADSPRGVGRANLSCDCAIRSRRAGGNLAKRRPNTQFERGAAHFEIEI